MQPGSDFGPALVRFGVGVLGFWSAAFSYLAAHFFILGRPFFIFRSPIFWILRWGSAGYPQIFRNFRNAKFGKIFRGFLFWVAWFLFLAGPFFHIWPAHFLHLGRTFFDLGSAGSPIWAPGMFPYGEVFVKYFFRECEIYEK